MMTAMPMAAVNQIQTLTNGSASSSGTTPSSLCSTPNMNHLLAAAVAAQQTTHSLFVPQYGVGSAHQQPQQMQVQAGGPNAYEGLPIFVFPHGVQQQITLAALQRVAESKAAGLVSSSVEPKVDTSKHHHIFIGDLSSEVDVKALKDAFGAFGEVSEAKVIRDAQTQKSKGYGFVSFPDKTHAEKAMTAMNGQVLGRRAIRTNWATRRPSDEAKEKLTFEQVFNSTKADNTSVYVGNVCQNTAENDLREAFKDFGTIQEVRIFKSQGYAFVRFERKEDATKAIMDMNGKTVAGNVIRCSWGRAQQQQTAIAPFIADYSPLLAAQQLLQQQQQQFTAQQLTPSPFWNPLQTAAASFPQYINPMAAMAPAQLMQQW